MILPFLPNATISFCLDLGKFGFGAEVGLVFRSFASHFFLSGHHFFLLFQLLLLHIFLSIQHVDLTLSLQFVHVLRTVSFMLCLRIQGFACFFCFAFNVLCSLLLRIGFHFGSFGGMFVLLGNLLRFDQFNGGRSIATGVKFSRSLGSSFQAFWIKARHTSSSFGLWRILRRQDRRQAFIVVVVIVISSTTKHLDAILTTVGSLSGKRAMCV
mmetsp:Transcript_101856/g.285492  ORF Transcript_101856/g.285492 Transcript_101856/m.285492 type:complete len:212 (-) Transcript_101856:85-720(-)